LPLRPELESVPAVELRPPPRVVTEPFPQRMGGTELLRPLIDRGPPPRQASRPQPINKDTFAIPAGGGFVRSLDLDHVLTFPLFGATSRLNLDDWGELNVRVGFAIASGVAGIPDRRPPHIEVLVRWRPILVFGRRVQEPEQRLEGDPVERCVFLESQLVVDRKSTRLNSSHVATSYAVFCLQKKTRCGPRGRSLPSVDRRSPPAETSASRAQAHTAT